MLKIEDDKIEMSGRVTEVMAEATTLFLCTIEQIYNEFGKEVALSYLGGTAKIFKDVTDAIVNDKNIYQCVRERVMKLYEEMD